MDKPALVKKNLQKGCLEGSFCLVKKNKSVSFFLLTNLLYEGVWTYKNEYQDEIVLELGCSDELLETSESANAFLTFCESETGECYEATVPLLYEDGKLIGDCEDSEIDGKLEIKEKEDKSGIIVSFTPSGDTAKEARKRYKFDEIEFVKEN